MRGTDFQQVVLNLERFWAEKGCVIGQPYDLEVGPWRVSDKRVTAPGDIDPNKSI